MDEAIIALERMFCNNFPRDVIARLLTEWPLRKVGLFFYAYSIPPNTQFFPASSCSIFIQAYCGYVSSAVEKVAFKDDVLYVEYKKGGNIYSYTTSKEVFDELLSSESIGRFMIAARKDNRIEDIGEIPF